MGRHCRGRSFVDTLCALVIGASLIALSVPRMTFARSRSSAAAREIAKALGLAQARALSSGDHWGVKFLQEPDRYLVWHDRDGDRKVDVEEIQLGPTRLAREARFQRGAGEDPVTFTNDQVVFRPTGSVRGIAGSVWLQVEGSRSRVTVIPNGRIYVYDDAGAP